MEETNVNQGEASDSDDRFVVELEDLEDVDLPSSSCSECSVITLEPTSASGDNVIALIQDLELPSQKLPAAPTENNDFCCKDEPQPAGVTTGDQAAEQITLPPKRMDSTEVLHSHHQFPPPTFSRLPPDGHEFPNNYWSDEKIIQFSGDDKCQFRNEYSVGTSSKPSSEPGSPPPLPTSEPPKEDPIEFPPLPNTVPPVPPKKMAAAQRYSFDDRKKLFESSPSSAKDMINTNGFTYPAKPSEEPSKKNVAVQPALPCHTVKDKIAMFSSRSNSSEDSDSLQSILPKKISNHVSSSLSKSTVHIPNSNGFSKSSENLLGTTTTGRKGSVDLSLAAHRDTTPPVPLYATMTRVTPNSTAKPLSLYERSQSMVDVGGADLGGKNASYQNSVNQSQPYTSNQYGSSTLGKPVVVSNMMEQRRKCMTKLRGLVIPDGPTDGTNSAAESGSMRTRTCASVMDLPTIKPASLYPATDNSQLKKSISRTESLDRFSSSIETTSSFTKTNCSNNNNNNNNNDNQSAKTNSALQQTEYTSNGFPNILPKYSPAFKRRGLSTYQPSTTTTLPSKISPPTTNKQTPGTTPEPKSLESLTSPKSDSSFEFSSSVSQQQQNHQRQKNTPPTGGVKSMEKPVEIKVGKEQTVKTNNNLKVVNGKSGKLEDSDNDSAVSSSRSSISHGLSPPNSPTPGESTAATPDPDLGSDDQKNEEVMMNMDESWRVLKPTSVEAINRKNVLKSAKFSSGGGLGQATKGDDSSFSSSNGKNRRSDDDEASYADAETEDTESSCSELEGSGNSRRLIETTSSRVTMMTHDQRDSKVETEDDDDDDDDEPAQQSAVNMEFTEMTESPLQAIYDIEVKMAYINEVCDALNERGRSDLPSRYFSRRDSEATVIEQPIEHKRTIDPEDSASITERRARNRSSSGNESDFSSNVSVGSQHNNHKSLSRETSSNNGTDTERWSMLEKKYSRSMTSVNSLGSKVEPQIPQTPQGLTPATSVPKIVKNCSTGASEVVEKKIEKIIEKSSTDGILKKTNPSIPRGRNDFKSIAEKWQSIESSSVSSPAPSRPQLATPPSTTPSILSKPSAPSPVKSSISDLKFPPRENTIPQTVTRTPSGLSSSSRDDSARIMQAKLEAMEADKAWAAEKCKSESEPQQQRVTSTGSGAGTKRSVSVNDIRKAFEKAEIAVNSYNGREGGSPTEEGTGKNKDGGLTLPAAHFRVSSFDSTTSEESGAPTPAGMYGSSNSLVSSAPKDPYGSITSLASSTSLISPQELQQLIDEANQSLEEAGTPSHEVSVVILHREISCGSLGITLAGGADYETKEITVHKVLTSSIADRDGRIHRCDRILSINGKSTKGLTHREALNLLKSPRTEVVLVVSRGRTANGFQTISETSALDRAIEPLLNGNLVIENDDDTCYKWGSLKTATLVKDGAGLGFSLEGGKGSIQGDKPLTVKKIFIGGPAEKSGELKLGDLIVSINGINMSSKSRTEAWNFMKKLNDGDVKITIRSPLV